MFREPNTFSLNRCATVVPSTQRRMDVHTSVIDTANNGRTYKETRRVNLETSSPKLVRHGTMQFGVSCHKLLQDLRSPERNSMDQRRSNGEI
jgi:hypothetical protein